MTAKQRERISEIQAELSELRDEEQAKFDNLPETFQAGEQGDRMQEGIDALENAISELEQITSA